MFKTIDTGYCYPNSGGKVIVAGSDNMENVVNRLVVRLDMGSKGVAESITVVVFTE